MSPYTQVALSASMVKAILNGHKTQIRVPCATDHTDTLNNSFKLLPSHQGNILWVTEDFKVIFDYKCNDYLVIYRAGGPAKRINAINTDNPGSLFKHAHNSSTKWINSNHMPYAACRLWLEITDIRTEQLQDITEDDARAEGMHWTYQPAVFSIPQYDSEKGSYLASYQSFWNKKYGNWDLNPKVQVYHFKIFRVSSELEPLLQKVNELKTIPFTTN